MSIITGQRKSKLENMLVFFAGKFETNILRAASDILQYSGAQVATELDSTVNYLVFGKSRLVGVEKKAKQINQRHGCAIEAHRLA